MKEVETMLVCESLKSARWSCDCCGLCKHKLCRGPLGNSTEVVDTGLIKSAGVEADLCGFVARALLETQGVVGRAQEAGAAPSLAICPGWP